MAVINKEKARRAVEYYFAHQPCSWGQALRYAGYSYRFSQNPSNWKKQAYVQKMIDEVKRKLTGEGGLKAEDIEAELTLISHGHGGKYVKVEEDGSLVPDYTNITERDKKLIKEITVDTIKRANGTVQTKSRVILYDRMAALKMLGQMKGAFKDHVEVKGEVSLVERLQRGRAQVCDEPRGDEIEEAPNGGDIY